MLLLQKADINSRRRFELKIESSDSIPTYSQLEKFLESQCRAFEIAENGKSDLSSNVRSKTTLIANFSGSPRKPSRSFGSTNFSNSGSFNNEGQLQKCVFCDLPNHKIYKCAKFLELEPLERHSFAKQNRLCFNCLFKHKRGQCKSESRCNICSQKHHTLLHFGNSQRIEPKDEDIRNSDKKANASTNSLVAQPNFIPNYAPSMVMLATICVNVIGHDGNIYPCRAILDSCSQSNFITERYARKVSMKTSKCSINVCGIGSEKALVVKGKTCFKVQSRLNAMMFDVPALVVPEICGPMPSMTLSENNWSYIQNLHLADPEWAISKKIDILLGAELFAKLLCSGKIEGGEDDPIALNTVFGWVLMGKIGLPSTQCQSLKTLACFVDTDSSLDHLVRKFWEIEQVVPEKPSLSEEDVYCEEIYRTSTTRDESGRYTVVLPFRREPSLGDSRTQALKRFMYLEKKLSKNLHLKQQYHEFMQEYLSKGYLERSPVITEQQLEYFIPHHAVLKEESTTTKCRVVFDASCKTSNGLSLNDNLLIGEKLQNNISSILLRFRTHQVVFTADIKQMYQQIIVAPEFRRFQQIYWRFQPSDPVEAWSLTRVPFGLNCSPWLALRTIAQLAEDEKFHFPLVTQVVKNDIYVDDVVSGADTVEEAVKLRDQLIKFFQAGQFELRKWTSNNIDFLIGIEDVNRELSLSFDEFDSVKILGLHWNPSSDSFFYIAKPISRKCTKRAILSELAKIYDPTGFLTPLTFFVKCLLQHLWCLGLDWDSNPPDYVLNRWNQHVSELPRISELKIPRKIVPEKLKECQLYGFCDASEKGYAAVVYLRFVDLSSQISVVLIAGKSKVAPLKRVSLPRLELCAAALLADLIKMVCDTYKNSLDIQEIFAYSDSTIALSWIKSSPHRWKTFVANRVSKIQDFVAPEKWFHVSSEENPADVASRGCLTIELVSHNLWWSGPLWLQSFEFKPTEETFSLNEDISCEEKRMCFAITHTSEENDAIILLIERHSSLRFIIEVVFQILRFGRLTHFSYLTHVDYQRSLFCLVKCVQGQEFFKEIDDLKKGKRLNKTLRKLALFVDSTGILRVGGRLAYSRLPFCQKFPALLPHSHALTSLIIRDYHENNSHPGLNTLRYLIQSQFWILGAKRAIFRVVSKCITCFKTNPRPLNPIMGNLPQFRVTQFKPFLHTGVDFGGPFNVTLSKHRGVKSSKAYICVFVCMATKALHIELVSDLSSEGFLAALRRFMGRRGRVAHMYSDNGTNFIGAYKQINEFFKISAESERLIWHFSPPAASSFGGIYEAAIKSIKTHLTRVIGLQILTYEELNTVLIQIEGLLNSRPISAMSNDPNDLQALTPGHFLTSEPLTAIPDPDYLDSKLSTLSRWNLLQRMRQDFWIRWKNEYLHTLIQKNKDGSSNVLKIGSLVIIKNELLPPLKWRLGRIVALYPGKDGINRVADVRTINGIFKRPLLKLCLLPVYD